MGTPGAQGDAGEWRRQPVGPRVFPVGLLFLQCIGRGCRVNDCVLRPD